MARKFGIGLCLSTLLVGVLWLQTKPSIPSLTSSLGNTDWVTGVREGGMPTHIGVDEDARAPRRLVVQPFETQNKEPAEGWVLAVALLRVAVCVYIAPLVLLYGMFFPKTLSFIKALTLVGFWLWFDKLAAIAYVGDIPPVMEGLVQVLLTGFTVGFTMAFDESLQLAITGGLLAYQGINQVLQALSVALASWADCPYLYMSAVAQRDQLYDSWTGCTKETEYYSGIWILKIIEWTAIIVGVLLARKAKIVINPLAAAMLGAEMCAAAILQAIEAIMGYTHTQKELDDVRGVLTVNNMIICYCLFGVGFMVQIAVRPFVQSKAQDDDARQGVHFMFRWATYIHLAAGPLSKMEEHIMRWLRSQCGVNEDADDSAPEKLPEACGDKSEPELVPDKMGMYAI